VPVAGAWAFCCWRVSLDRALRPIGCLGVWTPPTGAAPAYSVWLKHMVILDVLTVAAA